MHFWYSIKEMDCWPGPNIHSRVKCKYSRVISEKITGFKKAPWTDDCSDSPPCVMASLPGHLQVSSVPPSYGLAISSPASVRARPGPGSWLPASRWSRRPQSQSQSSGNSGLGITPRHRLRFTLSPQPRQHCRQRVGPVCYPELSHGFDSI